MEFKSVIKILLCLYHNDKFVNIINILKMVLENHLGMLQNKDGLRKTRLKWLLFLINIIYRFLFLSLSGSVPDHSLSFSHSLLSPQLFWFIATLWEMRKPKSPPFPSSNSTTPATAGRMSSAFGAEAEQDSVRVQTRGQGQWWDSPEDTAKNALDLQPRVRQHPGSDLQDLNTIPDKATRKQN